MTKISERSMQELYADDPERADALVFGRRTSLSRRGFLGGTGLAAMSAAVGGPVVFAASMPGGLIPAAQNIHMPTQERAIQDGLKINMNSRQPRSSGSFNARPKRWDSNGSRDRPRGSQNAQRSYERYMTLAQAEVLGGDIVAAENYFQHAEHYFRIINANGGDHGQNGRFRQGQRPDGQDQPIEAPIPGEGEQPQPADGRREVAGPGEEPYDPSEDPAGA
jgi:hypothetical protein